MSALSVLDLGRRRYGEVLELHVPAECLVDAADRIRGLGSGEPTSDQETRLVRLPVGSEGANVLLETVRRLDGANIPIEDIALHRPTLDDVFLSLTGHAAEMAELEDEASSSEPEEGKKKRRRRER